MTAPIPPFDINEHWANQPLTRGEAFMLMSKMQRLITSHSRFRLAMDQKDKHAAQQYSDEITALARELDGMLNGLVVMPDVTP